MTYARSKNSNAPGNNNFAASFMHSKLRRSHKEEYMDMGKSKARTGLPDSSQDSVFS